MREDSNAWFKHRNRDCGGFSGQQTSTKSEAQPRVVIALKPRDNSRRDWSLHNRGSEESRLYRKSTNTSAKRERESVCVCTCVW